MLLLVLLSCAQCQDVCVLLGATCRSDAGSQEGHVWGQDSGPFQCKAPQAVQEGLQAEA